MTPAPALRAAASGAGPHGLFIGVLLFLCAPWGLYQLRRRRAPAWIIIPYAVLGLPLFVLVYAFVGIVAFAAVLPDLDLTVSDQLERTVRFKDGGYTSTFIETAQDTGGAHEFIRVVIEPRGGNHPHYHRSFEETFTTEEGELTVHVGAETFVLKPGESRTAPPGSIHWFENPRDEPTTMTVRVTPAKGLEKSIRIVYGLSNTGRWEGASRVRNLWRVVFLQGYSESYVPGIPGFIQEPLIQAFAKIGQWLGEDDELKEFFQPRAIPATAP